MNHNIPSYNLTEASKEIKEKVVGPQHVWIIPDRYYLELDLKPPDALLLAIFHQTRNKKGFSDVSYSYIKKYTKQKDDAVLRSIKRLEAKKLIYVHRYASKGGCRRKYYSQDD